MGEGIELPPTHGASRVDPIVATLEARSPPVDTSNMADRGWRVVAWLIVSMVAIAIAVMLLDRPQTANYEERWLCDSPEVPCST